MASWLVCSTSERMVRVRDLAGDIVLCSWARHFTPSVPLSTQVYIKPAQSPKWVCLTIEYPKVPWFMIILPIAPISEVSKNILVKPKHHIAGYIDIPFPILYPYLYDFPIL